MAVQTTTTNAVQHELASWVSLAVTMTAILLDWRLTREKVFQPDVEVQLPSFGSE